MGLSDKENSSFPKETETRVRPGSQLAPENKTTESAASGHAAVKTTPKKARSKKRADKAADDHTGNYAARITPKAYETLVPGDIPEFEDTPERRALVEKRKKGRFMRRLRDWGIFTGYLTPSFLGVLLFFFLPLIMLLFTSFQKSPTNTDFVGFRNYERVLTNDAFIAASKNTLTFALISVPLAVVLALFLAMLLNSGLPGKSVFRSILLNPMMVPVASGRYSSHTTASSTDGLHSSSSSIR